MCELNSLYTSNGTTKEVWPPLCVTVCLIRVLFVPFSSFHSDRPECLLSHCIVAPMLALDPALPANLTVRELPEVSASLSAAKELLIVSKPFHQPVSVSIVVFHSQAEGKNCSF